jgi:SAM-dependent methyltransferase
VSSRHSILEPGNLLVLQERERLLVRTLRELGIDSIEGRRVFEAGCGGGYNLRLMLQWGARPEDLAGIDLDAEAVKHTLATTPGLRVHDGSADAIPEADGSFDLALAFTLFSSVPVESVAAGIGRELIRITRPGGFVFVYDMRYPNPWNNAVHRITRGDIRRWFPGCRLRTRSLTLLPQLARPIGRHASFLYGPLAAIPPLRSHALYVLQTPPA